MSKTVEVRVTGRVQGVSFRAHAQSQARRLGVAGWVRNDPDGAVSGHFEGPEHAVDALVAWCRRGPAHAEVDGLVVRAADPTGASDFGIRLG